MNEFDNTAADGDYGNFLNWSELSVPDQTTDAALAAIGTTGSFAVKDLTDTSGTGANYIQGGTITCHGIATGIQVNGGQLIGANAGSPILLASACIFNSDPGSANYITSNGTQFLSPMTASGVIQVDGTEIYGAVTITCAAIIGPQIESTVATVIIGGVTCNKIQCTDVNSQIQGTISQTGSAVDLYIGLPLTALVTWTNVTGLGTTYGCNQIRSAVKTATTLDLTLSGGGGTVSYKLPTVPVDKYVLTGHGSPGTLILPANGDAYLHGAPSIGVSDALIAGNYYAPSAGDVDSTKTFGVSNAVQGGNVSPANSVVLAPSSGGPDNYGPSNAQVGTATAGTNPIASGNNGKFRKAT